MVAPDLKTLTAPVGIVRILELILTCISFSLVASVGHSTFAFWTWCMFTWCFCFSVTFLILLLEFISLHERLAISWADFTTAFAMLATLMVCAILTTLLFVFVYTYCQVFCKVHYCTATVTAIVTGNIEVYR